MLNEAEIRAELIDPALRASGAPNTSPYGKRIMIKGDRKHPE